jgi:hypothetical protein
MTVDGAPVTPDPCGCCEEPVLSTDLFNRPGLAAIDYRIGVHGSFLRRMLRRLPGWPGGGRPAPLTRLTTREPSDPTVALLDAWATLADVLTFYQERIATEGFLRTATERRSLLELARTIGYELNPGLAASTYLAFRIEDRPPPPGMGPPISQCAVPKGTRVQSMPGQGELPQTFETGAELVARPEWNALRPRLTRPQPLSLESRRLYVAGATTGLVPGDRILVTAPAAGGSGVDTRILEVTAVSVEAALRRTRVDLAEVGKPAPPPQPPPPFKPILLRPATITLAVQPLTRTYVKQEIIGRRWTEKQLRAQRQIQYKHWKLRDLVDNVDFELRDGDLELDEPAVLANLPPAVESHAPAVGATGVPLYAKVLVTFNQPVDPATVSTATVQLRVKTTNTLVAAAVSYDEGSRTATLDPAADLDPDTDYTATVKGGRGGVADPSGLPVARDYTWSFHTDVERVRPKVIAHQPTAADEVDPSAAITATFSEKVRPETVTAATFTLSVDEAAVPASVSYDVATGTAMLVPAGPLARGTLHKAALTDGIKDLAGNALVPFEWSFTTRKAVPPPAELAAYAFRERASFFGHNAPKWKGLPKPQFTNDDPYPKDWDTEAATPVPPGTTRSNPDTPRTIWTDSQGVSHGGDTAYLERAIPGLVRDSWAVLESPTGIKAYWIADVAERSLVDYALSGKATQLRLSQPDGHSPSAPDPPGPPDLKVRATTAHVRSERLELSDLPIDDPLLAGDRELVLDRMVLDLDEGRPVVLSGERRDLPGVVAHEVLLLDEPVHQGGFTTLRFRQGLAHEYVRRTVTINANVAAATHGETVKDEVLGGGDGSQPNQRLRLHRPPLTHVSAPTASGSQSTLQVRVDDIVWEEARSLHDLGPRDRRYLVRTDDDGSTSVVFGDGVHGARPPTGTENVRATYRSGIGMAGMVAADKLTLLQTRPLGVQSVTNPLDASGAEEPERRDAARRNAPLTVLTLDRIVSLADVEDFTRAFAGIGKAQAVQLRRGEHAFVHLTVAAANGDEVAPTSSVYLNLVAAIDAARDPAAAVVVESYARRYFNLEAEVLVDRGLVAEQVFEAVRAAIAAAFSFERRDFGQLVSAAEVVTLIQGVPGVVMTDLRKLYLVQEQAPEAPPAKPLSQLLLVERARLVAGGGTAPGELLLVNPAGITLTEGTP